LGSTKVYLIRMCNQLIRMDQNMLYTINFSYHFTITYDNSGSYTNLNIDTKAT
jgi:hypothetical protein